MSSHFKFHDGTAEIVPWSAKYAYPTQASRTWKQIVKLPPVNGASFDNNGGQQIQINFPAQSYLDTSNSYLSFDLAISATSSTNLRLQNDIQSIFQRVRLMYGSMVLEDISEYGTLMRMLTECTGTNQNLGSDQTSVNEGKGGLSTVYDSLQEKVTFINSRIYNTQYNNTTPSTNLTKVERSSDATLAVTGGATATLPAENVIVKTVGIKNGTRTYNVKLGLGLFLQNKLLPLKWMASQLSLILTLAPSVDVLCGVAAHADAKYTLTRVNYIAQLLDFDGSYDAAFLEGLRGNGVPIKFATWNTYYSNVTSNKTTLTFPERNRSIKAAFVVQNPPPLISTTTSPAKAYDSHAMLQSSKTGSTAASTGYYTGFIKEFQWRVGGKFYPAQPVVCWNGTTTNGASEAYSELEKALNIVGDYRLSTSVNPARWCNIDMATQTTVYNKVTDWTGIDSTDNTDNFDFIGPSAFVIAGDFETSDGGEVSGINGEEQSSLCLQVEWSEVQHESAIFKTFVYYDALLVLRENNLIEIIK
jgi:hypothetical protein